MLKNSLLVVCVLVVTAFAVVSANAQVSRKSVSGAEVTGTFRYGFTGKFRGNYSDIKIQALGKGKLRVGFELTYPYMAGKEPMANVGTGTGEATIEGDTAVYETHGSDGSCKITIKFVRPGAIDVEQEQEGIGCGFGFNVSAAGKYRKISSKKPTFDEQ
jgi:hypothetical protein